MSILQGKPLHSDALKGDCLSIRRKIRAAGSTLASVQLSTPNLSGQTPLACAALKARMKAMEIFIEAGSSVDGIPGMGHGAPVTCGTKSGSLEVLRFLIVDHCAAVTNEAIFYATSRGNIEILDFLLSRSKASQINCTDCEGRTPLIVAAYNGNKAICKLLIDKGERQQV